MKYVCYSIDFVHHMRIYLLNTCNTFSILSHTKIQTYEEVVLPPECTKAMNTKNEELETSNMWYIIDLPLGKHPLSANGYIR